MDKGSVKLAPSILSADFARLEEQVAEAEAPGRVQKVRALVLADCAAADPDHIPAKKE